MKTTIGGIIVRYADGHVLLGHPTNYLKNTWGIPKGMPDESDGNELVTLHREILEETGIDVNKGKWTFIRLGVYPYKHNRKQLIAYLVIENEDNIKGMVPYCDSYVNDDPDFPEIDEFKWEPFKVAAQMVDFSQTNAFNDALEKYSTYLPNI